MEIIQKFMTSNDCYKAGRKITVKGLMVHSTATPGVMAATWYDRWNKSGIEKGVHAFLDANECYQYLPWNHRGWHAGGAANNTHIGIEWCEPKDYNDREYLDKIWPRGVQLYAGLCRQFGLTEKNIIAHYEGYKLGVASNHADPAHWWKLHGKTMDMFRSEVGQALRGEQSQPAPASVAQPAPAPEPPKPSGDATIRGIQHWVNVNYGTGIAEDGYFGPQTKTALVKAYQREVGVTADGIFGPKSKAAAKVIRIGSQGMLTNVGQAILYCLGFDPQGIDGVFGRNTADAALAFQRSRGLGQDAIIGKNTWEALFRG